MNVVISKILLYRITFKTFQAEKLKIGIGARHYKGPAQNTLISHRIENAWKLGGWDPDRNFQHPFSFNSSNNPVYLSIS